MLFTDVGYDCYVQTEKIKFIISYLNTKTVSLLVKEAEESLRLFNMTTNKSTLSLVVLEDNTVLRSPLKACTIYDRVKSSGGKLYQVDPDYYISVLHIKAITASSSFMAMNSKRKAVIAGNDLQFVRQRESKETTIFMTTGETVSLSKYTQDIIDEMNRQFVLQTK